MRYPLKRDAKSAAAAVRRAVAFPAHGVAVDLTGTLLAVVQALDYCR